ncbi:MAG: Flp family type IVb pilin [Bryobacterales bacterium]|nr:Flp family type IVb pilin [Bryobacterales bacterium]
MLNTLKNFVREEEGQDLVEYALLLALITLAVAAVLPGFADTLNDVWTAVSGKLTTASS